MTFRALDEVYQDKKISMTASLRKTGHIFVKNEVLKALDVEPLEYAKIFIDTDNFLVALDFIETGTDGKCTPRASRTKYGVFIKILAALNYFGMPKMTRKEVLNIQPNKKHGRIVIDLSPLANGNSSLQEE